MVQPNLESVPVQLEAAGMSASIRTGSIQMLLLVIVGALAVAGIIGSVIFRFGSMRAGGWPRRRDRRHAIWDSTETDRPSPDYPRAGVSISRIANNSDRITEMFTRLSRSPAR